jgi:hypothetical protein
MMIAKRTLKLRDAGRDSDLAIRIFAPVYQQDECWLCRWEIDWPDRQRTNSGRGTDAIQALVNALQMVGTEIYCSEEHRSGKLIWHDDWSGYGLPVPGNLRDALAADDKKYL